MTLYLIRPLTLKDIPQVAQIEQKSRPTPWNENQFANELENINSHPLVLLNQKSGKVIGYAIAWIVAGEIQIQNIVVTKTYRCRRLGSLLLNLALTMGFDSGCDQAILEVRESNTTAINLYHQYQFGIVGQRKNYYRDGETALLMTAGPFKTKVDLNNYREFISKRATDLQDQLQFIVE